MDRYVIEGLPPEERCSFEIHVKDCQDCRQQLASLRQLLAVLQSDALPPVPAALTDRVMTRAHREVQAPAPSFRGARLSLRSWWGDLGAARVASGIAAVAAGLLIGLVLGEQSWQQVRGSRVVGRPAAQMESVTAESLDYLTGFPGNSFSESYLSLIDVANARES
jgi:anti-sigma factor RsiW